MVNFFNTDCMEFMANVPDKFYDLAIVDPPYGIGEDGSKNHSRGITPGSIKKKALGKSKDYKPYSGNDKEPPSKEYFKELVRVCKNQIIWGANHFISRIPFDSSCWIVWDKNNGLNDFADCELAYTSFDTAVRKFKWTWHGMLQENMKNKQERIHPNEKPIELYRWTLQKYATKGMKILDTHGGSFSHAIAADMEGFDLDIMEIDKDYYEAGVNRFNQYKRQLKLF